MALGCSSLLLPTPSIHSLAYFHLSFIFLHFIPNLPPFQPSSLCLCTFAANLQPPSHFPLLCFAFMAFYDVCVTSRLFPFLSPSCPWIIIPPSMAFMACLYHECF